MKKLLVFTLLLLPVQPLAPTQIQTMPDIAFTEGMPNGRFWSRRTLDEKRVWLVGYSDGIKTAAAFVYAAEPANEPLRQAILDLQPTSDLTPVEIVQGMNHFYQDTPENAPVPLGAAMHYVKRKASGSTPSELDEIAARLRRAWATIDKKQ